MKTPQFLNGLLRLLLPAFVEFQPFVQLPSQSLDHPERVMEQRGQINCLDHNVYDLDVLRRFEAPLFNYPEVRVGCETFSAKPFRPYSEPPLEPEDRWAWIPSNEQEVSPKKAMELEDKVAKYFVIDMYGNETKVGPGSTVTVETYDLSQVYNSGNDFFNAPTLSDLTKRPETFTFEQLCFPSVCYRSGEKKEDDCRNVMERFTPEDGGSFLLDCAGLPSAQCNFRIGHTAEVRRSSKGKSVGSVFSSNIMTYCSLEASNGRLLGPLRTPNYSNLLDLLNSSSTLRTQVPSGAIYMYKRERDKPQGNFRISTLLSSHYRSEYYKNETLVTSCFVTVPLEAPFNTSFGVDFFVAENQFADEKPIRPGQQVTVIGYRSEGYKSEEFGGATMYRLREVPYKVKFEDLCFPAECFHEPPPGEDAKCEFKPGVERFTPPGAVFMYIDEARSVKKLLYPTEL